MVRRKGFRLMGQACLSLLLASAGGALAQQEAEGKVIREVRVAGVQRLSQTYVLARIETRAGQPYRQTQIDRDLETLLRTGQFLTAEVRTEPADDQVIVTFAVVEKKQITTVDVTGCKKFSAKDLLKEAGLRVGDTLDVFAVRQAAQMMTDKYHEAGYAFVEVTYDAEALSRGEVHFRVTEGPRVKVRRILFEGAPSFDADELRSHVSTKTYLWIISAGLFDEQQVQRDADTLRQFYIDQGFLDARVSYRLDFSEDRKDLTIVFVVQEGTRYAVEWFRFEGNVFLTEGELAALLPLKSGDFLLADRLEQGLRAIRRRYGQNGFIYATVDPDVRFSEQPGLVQVTIKIDEDGQFRVGELVIRGNRQTQDKVILRELRLAPEDVFDLTKAEDSERRLRETYLFSEAAVRPIGNLPDVRNAVVEVKEAQANIFLIGVGVSTDSGALGNILIENRNFDLFDWPRSFEEFIHGQAFRGAGQTLRFQFEPGTELTRFRIDFREPYLMDQPISLGLSAYLFSRDRDAYNETRMGLMASIGKRFESGPLKDWAAEIAGRAEWVNIDDVEDFAARDIRDVEGMNFLPSVQPAIVRDRTDSRFLPTTGDRFKLSWEQFLGDYSFARVMADYDWYKTLHIDRFERKHVLGLRGTAGYIVGDAPVFERFYTGGITTLRGFEYRGISPRAGLRDDCVGGDFLLLAGAEYTFPLYGKSLRGVLFTDMGTVEEDFELTSWRVSVGAGVRLIINFFGPVPLEFNVAAPVLSDDEDDTQIFSFAFRTAF
jgi:outer membrane protein insertion porin family